MTTPSTAVKPVPSATTRSRAYLVYPVAFLGSVALMDNYVSGITSLALS